MPTGADKQGYSNSLKTVDAVIPFGDVITEQDSGRTKTGNGFSSWNELPYDTANQPFSFTIVTSPTDYNTLINAPDFGTAALLDVAVTGDASSSQVVKGDDTRLLPDDLSGYVPTTRTINGHALSFNVTVTPSDVGSPSGSGTSTGSNTGDQVVPANTTATAGSYFSAYNATTGAFTKVALPTTGDAFVANPLSQFASTTSAQLRGVLSDELGTGAALFDGATPTSFTLTNATGLPIAGISGLGTGVGTALAATPNATGGVVTFSGNIGAATGSGLVLSSGSIATSQPFSLVQTWNASGVTFTGIDENVTDTASAAASLLLNLRVGSVSKFSITKTGSATTNSLTINNTGQSLVSSGQGYFGQGIQVGNGATFAFSNGTDFNRAIQNYDSTTLQISNGTGGTFQNLILNNLTVSGGTITGPSTGIKIVNGFGTSLVTKTGAYTATGADHKILCDTTSSAFTITLPTAVGIAGKEYIVKDWKGTSATNNITIACAIGGQTIDGSATKIISTNYFSISFVSDGANYSMF